MSLKFLIFFKEKLNQFKIIEKLFNINSNVIYYNKNLKIFKKIWKSKVRL